ncbi:MAG: glycoside hydrolase family 38 N-terminal domain-containing protein [Limisphaerales bacterium]
MNFIQISRVVCLGLVVLSGFLSAAEPDPTPPQHVRQLDLIHFSHTDYGFTDHPAVCRDMQIRYLDVALDAARATRTLPEEARFRWTAETTVAVNDWWQAASPGRRAEFIEAVRAGQIEVTALPFNNTPFLSRDQWQAMTHWLPEELWREVSPQTAVQNDVNGFPRAGAAAILDRGVRYLFAGINSDSGGPPLPRLTAFWWKQPDGRRLFVWMSLTYGDGFFFFERDEWRRGPLPLAADARFRPPRAGDVLKTDEASLRAAHRQCLTRLQQFEREGYRHPVLAVSMTSMWRYDNDPPFPPLSDFVAAWNRLGLEPKLRLTTVSQAMRDLEQVAGPTAPEYEGEWTDWWANGTASAPREVAASRSAKRFLAAAQSPVWGPMDDRTRDRVEDLTRDVCLFDEHTWGSGMSVGQPYSLDAQGQFNEKARLAWRPMALAEWLLGQRARTRLVHEGEGLWVANPASRPYRGWATLISSCLREDYRSLVDPATGTRRPLYFEPGPLWGRPSKPEDLSREDVSATFPDRVPDRFARFWVDTLEADSVRRYQLSLERASENAPTGGVAPTIKLDAQGWPTDARWPGMKQPLFTAGLGDFVSVKVNAFAPRWVLQDLWGTRDEAKHRQLRDEKLAFISAQPAGPSVVEETPHTIRYTQPLDHPRLEWATRRLELWKGEPRARLTFRMNRRSSFDPELLCVVSPMPCDSTLPRLSSGGMGFTPFTDQMPGTCRDYFAIDGWAHYATADGHWLWVTRDAPLVTLDGPHPKAHLTSPPPRPGRMLAIVYDNFWYTNFQGDSPGVMEFQFDLAWNPAIANDREAEALAQALATEPVMVLNPALSEHPLLLQHLFKP